MLQQSFTRMHVKRLLTRIYATGLVMRFSIVGLTVGLLVAGGLAWFIEAQLTDLLLTTVAARAADQVDHLGMTGYVRAEDFAAPHTPGQLRLLLTAASSFQRPALASP